jgi:hemerythrin-like metal-binding protein
MDQFVWKSSFEIGIEKIDSEHKLLLKHLNAGITNPTKTEGIFDELKKYAEFHFSGEENLMRKTDYPELQTHIQGHQLFVDRVQQLEKAIIDGEKTSVTMLIAFLRDWFIYHILLEDKNFANYVRANFKEDEIANLYAQGCE